MSTANLLSTVLPDEDAPLLGFFMTCLKKENELILQIDDRPTIDKYTFDLTTLTDDNNTSLSNKQQ